MDGNIAAIAVSAASVVLSVAGSGAILFRKMGQSDATLKDCVAHISKLNEVVNGHSIAIADLKARVGDESKRTDRVEKIQNGVQ